jgi:hypothetical protein
MVISDITEVQKQELVGFAQAMNDKLFTSTSGGAEQAFGLSCGLGLIPVIGVILFLMVFKFIDLIPGLLFLVIALLGLVGVSMLLANLARNNAQKRVFQTEIDPEIDQYLNNQLVPRQVFDTLASQALPPDAPLQAFLSPVFEDEPDQSEDGKSLEE